MGAYPAESEIPQLIKYKTPEWFSPFGCIKRKKVNMDTIPEPTQDPSRDPLRDLLRDSRAHPPLASNFQNAVWRRIERTEAPVAAAPSLSNWLERWVETLLVPRFALAGLASMLVIGGLTGMATSAGDVREQAQARYLDSVAPNTIR